MKELDLQDKYLMNFLCKRADGLQYNEAKANTVSSNFFVIEDLKQLLSETELNKVNYKKLLRKFDSEKELLTAFTQFLDERISSSMNMAIFIHNNQSVTFEGTKLHLFYLVVPKHMETNYSIRIFFRLFRNYPTLLSIKTNNSFPSALTLRFLSMEFT